MSKLDVVVLQYGQPKLTANLFASMKGSDVRVIFVDNGSSDADHIVAMRALERSRLPHVVLRVKENIGFPRAVNAGVGASSAPYVCIQGNDTVVYSGCYERLMKAFQIRPEIGAVGPLTSACATRQKVDVLEHAWPDVAKRLAKTEFCSTSHPRRAEILRNTFPGRVETLPIYISFFCTMLKRSTWDQIGPLDHSFSPCFGEDNDYCARLKTAGFKLGVAMDVYVHHIHRGTISQVMTADEVKAVKKRNGAILDKKWAKPQ